MFAFKGRRAIFYSAAADCADRWCAQQETGPEDAGWTGSHARIGYRMTVVPSRGCLALESSIVRGPAHNRHEGSPPWSCLQQCAPRIFSRPPFS